MACLSESPNLEGQEFCNQVKNATGLRQQDASEVPARGGFLFIASFGTGTKQDRQQLRTLRGHVMQNYLDRRDAEKQEIEHNNTESISLIIAESRQLTPAGGQRMKFRLRSGELELRHPYRYRKGKNSMQKKEAAKKGKVPGTIMKEPSVIAEWQLATNSGFVPGVPVA